MDFNMAPAAASSAVDLPRAEPFSPRARRRARPRRTHRVSVVIPAHNRVAMLLAAVASVYDQPATQRELEVIVVDDGSTCDIRTPLLARFPRVTYYRKANGGPASARHYGSLRARGDILAYLDDDDLWVPGKLKAQLELLDRHPEASWVFCNMVKFDESLENIISVYKVFPALWSSAPRRLQAPETAYLFPGGSLLGILLAGVPLYTQTIVMRRSFYERFGGWNESIPGCGEDLDFFLRAALGQNVGYLDKPYVKIRRRHGDNMTDNLLHQQMEQAGTIVRLMKHYPPDLRRALRARLGEFIAKVAWMAYDAAKYRAAFGLYSTALRHGFLRAPSLFKWLMAGARMLIGRRGGEPGAKAFGHKTAL